MTTVMRMIRKFDHGMSQIILRQKMQDRFIETVENTLEENLDKVMYTRS